MCILRSSRFLHFFSSSNFLSPERLGGFVSTLALPFPTPGHTIWALERRMHEEFLDMTGSISDAISPFAYSSLTR